jgi:hypothetical protein
VATHRTALAIAYVAVAMVTAAACLQLNEALNSRDLECGEVPADICTRLADFMVGGWDPLNAAETWPDREGHGHAA